MVSKYENNSDLSSDTLDLKNQKTDSAKLTKIHPKSLGMLQNMHYFSRIYRNGIQV